MHDVYYFIMYIFLFFGKNLTFFLFSIFLFGYFPVSALSVYAKNAPIVQKNIVWNFNETVAIVGPILILTQDVDFFLEKFFNYKIDSSQEKRNKMMRYHALQQMLSLIPLGMAVQQRDFQRSSGWWTSETEKMFELHHENELSDAIYYSFQGFIMRKQIDTLSNQSKLNFCIQDKNDTVLQSTQSTKACKKDLNMVAFKVLTIDTRVHDVPSVMRDLIHDLKGGSAHQKLIIFEQYIQNYGEYHKQDIYMQSEEDMRDFFKINLLQKIQSEIVFGPHKIYTQSPYCHIFFILQIQKQDAISGADDVHIVTQKKLLSLDHGLFMNKIMTTPCDIKIFSRYFV